MNKQMTLDEFAEALLNTEPIETTQTLTYTFDEDVIERYAIVEKVTFTVDTVRGVVKTIRLMERLLGPLLNQADDGEHFIVKYSLDNYVAKIREFLDSIPTDILVTWLNEVEPEASYE